MRNPLSRISLCKLFLLSLWWMAGAVAYAQTEGSVADTLSRPDILAADSVAADTAMVNGKEKFSTKLVRTGNIFVRFVKSFNDMDTTYIVPNYYNYAAMIQNTNFLQVYRLKAVRDDGHVQTIHMSPKPSFRIGPYFGWRWIFLGYTFDISHPNSAGKTTELSLSLYSSMLGVDLVYIKNKGDFTIRKVSGFGEQDDLVRSVSFAGADTYTTGINLYYVFNHKRFSYPAAFAQSTVQRKSCGSWMMGFRYDSQRLEFDYNQLPPALLQPSDVDNPGLIDEMKISKIGYRNYSLSLGYAYNWVFAPRFLFSVSMAPSFGIKQANGERITGDSFLDNVKNFNVDFIARGALVWNNNRWFAGVSAVSHLYAYSKERFSMTNNVNYVNVYVGFNFNKRKQYR